MEVYRTQDGHVAKYVHDDGSETAIKTTPIIEYGGVYGKVTNKYNIFISTSVGCPVGCQFCYLTTKKCPYHTLTADEIISNVLSAVRLEVKHRPELARLYAKLSWMGMGDAYIDTQKMYEVSCALAGALVMNDLARGSDGVDISTTLPFIPKSPKEDGLRSVANYINCFSLNPERKYGVTGSRYPVRLFYSLYSGENNIRKFLIPSSVSERIALDYLSALRGAPVTLVVHHMFFEGINDTLRDAASVLKFLEVIPGTELRLLRFNECPGSIFKESSNFDMLVEHMYKYHKNIKVQSSPGSEVQAACGQFLLSKILNK
ncbi:hypothetical protein JZU46_02865 [bacterium]|nr:hypothetical protein [bacterium]